MKIEKFKAQKKNISKKNLKQIIQNKGRGSIEVLGENKFIKKTGIIEN